MTNTKNFSAGTYNDSGVWSVGASFGRFGHNVGGTIGIDKKKKRPFASINIKGKVIGSWGPQGD